MITDFIRGQIVDFIRGEFYLDSNLEVEIVFTEIKHSPYDDYQAAREKKRQACLKEIQSCDISKVLIKNGFTIQKHCTGESLSITK